jgi:hypothetical protein
VLDVFEQRARLSLNEALASQLECLGKARIVDGF